VRKRLSAVPLRERVASVFGEELYTTERGRRTYVEAVRLADELLRAGWPVIVDGNFSHAAERAEARAVADRHGLPFAVLWCDAPDEALVKRLRSRSEDRHEASDGREELLAEHRARYEVTGSRPRVVRLDTGGEMAWTVERAMVDVGNK
jgi:predicted kinase